MLKRSFVLLAVLVLGFALAGCGKCGDWLGRPGAQVCKEDVPR
jgi:predicted small lipoprotein YifL